MSNELTTQLDASAVEQVLISGDLSKLSPVQRVNYYKSVCESMGLNPLTKPFDYITLNGRLTLYAKKDATDQLRSIKGVSIDDVDLQEVGDHFIVKVKGHDATGRADVEIGVVNKKDMQGNLANAQMKAVTKAKRRLTLSLCGLGWLDETEVETIPDARPVLVEPTTGVIVEPELKPGAEMGTKIEPDDEPVVVLPTTPMTIERAYAMTTSDGVKYGDIKDNTKFTFMSENIAKKIKNNHLEPEVKAEYQLKLKAIEVILKERASGAVQ